MMISRETAADNLDTKGIIMLSMQKYIEIECEL